MNRISAVVVLASTFLMFAQIGCSSEEDAAPPADLQTISGQIDTGTSEANGLGTRTLAPLTTGHGELHVVAHRLGKQGAVDVHGDVDAVVLADGSFDLKVARGARYVFEVERGAESVAYFGWKTKKTAEQTTVLGISAATTGKAAVTLGKVKIVGNGAVAEHCFCDSFDENDLTGIDLTATWFVSARGALITAGQALEEASAALDEAAKQLDEAAKQLDEAAAQTEQAADDAREAARVAAEATKAATGP